MNQGESKRGNRLAVCDSPDRELEAGAINPVILSSAPVSNFQFQISPAYDPLGRLASTTAGGVTVRHLYDGAHCVADTDSSGRVVKSYTWGPGIDNLLAVTCHSGSSSTTYYALTDIQGTVHGFADASGNLFETYAYDAWGNVLAVRDSNGLPIPNLKSQIGNRYLFQGREYSWATGLYNFRLRWYDPATGRWLSKDPIGISGGLNLYAFCGDDPVNYVDPWGESWVGKAGKFGAKHALRSKTFRKLLQKGRNLVGHEMSPRQLKREIKKSFPGEKAVYHTDDITARTYGPHAQPASKPNGMSRGAHLFKGEAYNATKDVAKALTVGNYLGDNLLSNLADFFNPLSIGQDIVDIIDEVDAALKYRRHPPPTLLAALGAVLVLL